MTDYRRCRIPGGCYFFTVNLLEGYPNDELVRHINLLRAAIRQVGQTRPLHIDRWVVLPDHMHCIWSFPPNDGDFVTRVEADQDFVREELAEDRTTFASSPGEGRAGYLATLLLGARYPR